MKPFILLLFITLSSYSITARDTEWWKHMIIYQILPYSFKDSDGDGIGDLKGITSKIDHLADLNIETIHLTPIYESTFLDMGYDVNDYYKIDPKFGTMDDFDELVRKLKKKGMKLILDLVINHSGRKHEWFQKSVERIDPYTDFYVWKDPKGYDENGAPIAPNKWVSVFGGSAWKWHDERKQFYLHQFMEDQVDFDLNNAILKKEIKKIIKFWLDRGVAGFRLDAVIFYIEDEYLRDDNNQIRQYNQQGSYDFVGELRAFLNQYNSNMKDFERIFIAEAHSDDHYVLRYYGDEDYPLTHFPYAFQLEYVFAEINAIQFDRLTRSWIMSLPQHAVSLWMTQDHDGKRVGSRIRPEYSDIMTMASMMLPGAVGCYYGQEIAMMNGHVEPYQIKDISGSGARDPTRLIMQWDETINAGFTSNDVPYLPPNDDFSSRNVDFQKSQQISHYNMFKNLSKLRTTDEFKNSDFEAFILSEDIYVFTRSHKNIQFVVVINFGHTVSRVYLNQVLDNYARNKTPRYASIAAASVNAAYQKGFEFEEDLLKQFIMTPLSSLVLSVIYWENSSDQTTSSNKQFNILNDGKSTNVQIRNGVVKVDGTVVHISSDPTTKFTFDETKIYANNVPVFDLVTKKPATINSKPATEDIKKYITVQMNTNTVRVNGDVVYETSYYAPTLLIQGKFIYADGDLIYEAYSTDTPTNRPKKWIYGLHLNGQTTTIALSNGIVNVDGKATKYTSPNSIPELKIENNKIFVDDIPLYQIMTQSNPPTNSTPLTSFTDGATKAARSRSRNLCRNKSGKRC